MISVTAERRFVYFVEAENGMVKIGESCDPDSRAKGICANSPIKARLIISLPAARKDEGKYHARFKACRAWNEWFYPSGDLAAFIRENRGSGVSRILDWAEISDLSRQERHRIAGEKQSAALRAAWADPERRASMLRYRNRNRVRNGAPAQCEASQ